MSSERHRDVQSLLPWSLNLGLDEAEQERVRAHLDDCAECRADLREERRLSEQVVSLPLTVEGLDVERGWARMEAQLRAEPAAPQPSRLAEALRELTRLFGGGKTGWAAASRSGVGAWMTWALAAQACLLLVFGAALWRAEQPGRYHALGAPAARAEANIAVVFRPDTPERSLRGILRRADARLVGGPTVADAYLLHVEPSARSAVLKQLRRRPEIVLAEPVDGG